VQRSAPKPAARPAPLVADSPEDPLQAAVAAVRDSAASGGVQLPFLGGSGGGMTGLLGLALKHGPRAMAALTTARAVGHDVTSFLFAFVLASALLASG
jgi:hypothetical protein